MNGSQWPDTTAALGRLIRLLSCPLCDSLMGNPCVLNSCNHHFCRSCIEWSISEKQASCPVCHLPAWAKDVKSDRQISTVIRCVSSMESLIVQGDERDSAQNTHDNSCGKPIRRKVKSRRVMRQQCLIFPQLSKACKPSPVSPEKGPSPKPSSNDAPARKTPRMRRRNIRGETPLHIAAIKGNLSVMQDLLQQGLNPNVRDNAGWTPLHESCNHGHINIATLLLDHGALVNAPGFDGDTPLHDAVANGHFQVTRLLISRGANPLLRNYHGYIAGDFATTESMKNLLSLPLETGPNASAHPVYSKRELVLLGTGLKSHQKVQLEETTKQLGALTVESFTSQVTHLITITNQSKCCPRTMKFLCAIAEGKWIISFQWVIRCNQEKQWVDETAYEVLGSILEDKSFITYAPQKGRENATLKGGKLFSGCQFYFAGKYYQPNPSKQDLENLVKMAGGTVLDVDPRNSSLYEHAINPYAASGSGYVVLLADKIQKYKTPCIFRVSPSWIFDCLSEFKLLL